MVSSPILSESSENSKNAFSPLAIEVDSLEALSGLLTSANGQQPNDAHLGERQTAVSQPEA